MQHLPQVHVGVDELTVVAVNHGWSVGSGEYVRRAFAAKRAQGDGLGTEAQGLAVLEGTGDGVDAERV